MARTLTPRGDLYRRPEAGAWFARTGRAAFPLPVDLDSRTLDDAHALCMADASTIDGEAASAIHDQIHMLCEVVRMLAAEPETSTCFFDDSEGRFWIYPEAAAIRSIP